MQKPTWKRWDSCEMLLKWMVQLAWKNSSRMRTKGWLKLYTKYVDTTIIVKDTQAFYGRRELTSVAVSGYDILFIQQGSVKDSVPWSPVENVWNYICACVMLQSFEWHILLHKYASNHPFVAGRICVCVVCVEYERTLTGWSGRCVCG